MKLSINNCTFSSDDEVLKLISSVSSENGINIKKIGAKGDGINDDTNIIQNEIEKMKNIGGTLYFPEGTYICNIKLYSNINIIGQNPSKTILKSNIGSTEPVISSYDYGNYNCNRNIFSNFSVDGNKDNAECIGIKMFGRSYNWDNIDILNCKDTGIITGSSDLPAAPSIDIWSESKFFNIKSYYNKTGWEFNGPHDSIFISCHMMHNDEWGLIAKAAHQSYFLNCYANSIGGFKISGCRPTASNIQLNSDYYFLNNKLFNQDLIDYGIYIKNGGGINLNGGHIDGFGICIYAENCSNSAVISHTILSRSVCGIKVSEVNQLRFDVSYIHTTYGVWVVSENHNNYYKLSGSFDETNEFLFYDKGVQLRSGSIIDYTNLLYNTSYIKRNGKVINFE